MKLIGGPASPYNRKVRIVLAEKRIDYDYVIEAPYEPESRVSEYNPLGKIPVLVLDDDTTLFDSRVIVEYLDSANPVGRLIPDDIRQRIHVRRWEAVADGCNDALLGIVMEKRRLDAQQSAAWIAWQQAKIDRAAQTMSEELNTRAWCSGELYNLADIAVGCALSYLDLRLPEFNWRKSYANLAKLYDKLSRRASFRDTALETHQQVMSKEV